MKTFKKENIFLDLSKCTEEEIKETYKKIKNSNQNIHTQTKRDLINGIVTHCYWFLFFDGNAWNQNGTPLSGRTELTYPEFIKLFEGGETSAENEEVKLFEENQRRAGIRHAMYLLESFKEDYYSVDAKSLYNSIDVLCDFVRSKGADIEPLNWISKEVLQVDIYSGELNTERILTYKKLSEQYNIEESTVRDIFNAGADWVNKLKFK